MHKIKMLDRVLNTLWNTEVTKRNNEKEKLFFKKVLEAVTCDVPQKTCSEKFQEIGTKYLVRVCF